LEVFVKYFGVFITAVFKYWLAFPAAKLAGFTYWQCFIITTVGGYTSFLIFYFFSKPVFKFLNTMGRWIKNVFPYKIFKKKKSSSKKTPSIFSTRSRLFVKIYNRFGIIGLAFISPSLISIPIGSTIAANLSARSIKKKSQAMIAFFAAVCFWSFVFSALMFVF